MPVVLQKQIHYNVLAETDLDQPQRANLGLDAANPGIADAAVEADTPASG